MGSLFYVKICQIPSRFLFGEIWTDFIERVVVSNQIDIPAVATPDTWIDVDRLELF